MESLNVSVSAGVAIYESNQAAKKIKLNERGGIR